MKRLPGEFLMCGHCVNANILDGLEKEYLFCSKTNQKVHVSRDFSDCEYFVIK